MLDYQTNVDVHLAKKAKLGKIHEKEFKNLGKINKCNEAF